MKVLIIVPEYPSANSNGYQFVHDRVKEYQAHFEVDVFCCRSDGQLDYVHEDVSVICGTTKKLISLIKSDAYTHYVIHYLTLVNAIVLLLFLRNKRTYLWFHGSDSLSWKRRLSRIEHKRKKDLPLIYYARVALLIMSNRFRSRLIKWINRACNQLTVVFVSQWAKQATEADNREQFRRAVVIPNYVNPQKFIYHPKDASDRYRVLSITNFSTNIYAGDILRDVLMIFSKDPLFPKFQFDIYGDGALFEQYTQPLRGFDNIKVTRDFLSHQEIAYQHDLHGILLYPKRGDTQGVSRCEAMLSGVVPLASDVEAISEYSPEHTSYLAVTVDDFLEALRKIDADPEGFLARSKAGTEFMAQKCSYANTIQKEVELLQT